MPILLAWWGYWNFDEGSGSSALDSSGNGNNGTWSGTGTHYIAGKAGQASSFNGTDDYITIPDSSLWKFGTNDFSISFWYQKVGSQSSYPSPLEYWSNTSSTEIWWIVDYCQSAPYDKLTFSGGLAFTITNPSAVCDGNWHYVTFVAKSSLVTSYIDAALISTSTQTQSITATGSSNLLMGTDKRYVNYLHAYLDDMRIYNRALSVAEIAAIYNATK